MTDDDYIQIGDARWYVTDDGLLRRECDGVVELIDTEWRVVGASREYRQRIVPNTEPRDEDLVAGAVMDVLWRDLMDDSLRNGNEAHALEWMTDLAGNGPAVGDC